MWDGLKCKNRIISTPPRITSLDLSSSSLTGTIAAAIQNLTQLERLDLSNNNLVGELPEFLGNIKSLLFINLNGNDFNGSIPQALLRKGVKLLRKGNPRLISPPKPPKKKFPVAIVVSVAFVAMIFIAALVLFLVLRKNKRSIAEAPLLPSKSDSARQLIEMKKKRFTYSEVIEMTNNFQRVLGKGGFGQVYHGSINGYEEVAVKVCSVSTNQSLKQFKAEVDLLLRVHHTNLVSLVGYCDEQDHLALIYEFVPNGDLKEHLSRKQGRPVINWGMRLRIALEAALAKLADFGLSRISPAGEETHVSTVVAGSFGYIDPEYYETSRLSEKSDVYSFGVVLLQMLTNKPVMDETREKHGITEWVRYELNRGEITRIMDPNLGVNYNSPSVQNALQLAMSCTNLSSTKRPHMSNIVSKLKECLDNLRGLPELCGIEDGPLKEK